MKTFTSVALLSLVNGIAAYPTLKSIYVRDCQPGHLVCQGNGQFGLCNIDSTAIFMKVAEGTKCVCSGSECTIAALEDGDAPAPQPTQDTPAPAPTSQVAPPPAATQPAPETTQPASQAPQQQPGRKMPA